MGGLPSLARDPCRGELTSKSGNGEFEFQRRTLETVG